MNASLVSGGFNANISIYDACRGNEIVCEATNSSVLLDPGDEVYIRVAGEYLDGQGAFTLSLGIGAPPCSVADLAEFYGLLDLADINAFTAGFLAQDPIADLDNNGIFDLSDINLFTSTFLEGCG